MLGITRRGMIPNNVIWQIKGLMDIINSNRIVEWYYIKWRSTMEKPWLGENHVTK